MFCSMPAEDYHVCMTHVRNINCIQKISLVHDFMAFEIKSN